MAIKSMTVTELKQSLEKGEKLILIDCREQKEWDEAHIPAAKFMPLSGLEDQMNQLEDKNAPIVFQCRSGKRSMTACKMLEEAGFSDLTNLDGGILAWIEAGYETE